MTNGSDPAETPEPSHDPAGRAWARFSECRRYRYELWRQWGERAPYVMFIGLNPSTADETNDDPTIRRCIGYVKAWGYDRLCMTNLYAFRATDPDVMFAASARIGADNERTLVALAKGAALVVAAWGADSRIKAHFARTMLAQYCRLHALRLTKGGHPAHPLYLPKTLTPQPWLAGALAAACGPSANGAAAQERDAPAGNIVQESPPFTKHEQSGNMNKRET